MLHCLARLHGIASQGATKGATKRNTRCYIFHRAWKPRPALRWIIQPKIARNQFGAVRLDCAGGVRGGFFFRVLPPRGCRPETRKEPIKMKFFLSASRPTGRQGIVS